jgi:hypothetical protein
MYGEDERRVSQCPISVSPATISTEPMCETHDGTGEGHGETQVTAPFFARGEGRRLAGSAGSGDICHADLTTNLTTGRRGSTVHSSVECIRHSEVWTLRVGLEGETLPNLAMNPATRSGTNGGGSRRSVLADPRVVFGGAKPLSSRIMGPCRSSRSYTPSTPLAGGWESTARRLRASAPTGTWRVRTAEGRSARYRALGWTSSPTIVGRSGPTV